MSYHFPLSLSHSDKRQHQVQQQTNNCRVQSQASQEKTHPIHPKCLVIDTLTGDAQQPHRQFSATQKSRQPDNPRHPIPIPTSCANCGTLNTPLWRRNHLGATLCNACALFQKMKGRPRPMSLKTNVIKSRNRIKAIDRIPHQKNKDGMLSTSGSSNSSSSCSTPIHQHQQQPNLIQQATSRLGNNHSYHHSSPSSPSDPQFVKSSQTYLLHSDYNNRKQGSTQSSRDSFRAPLSNSSAINLPTQSFPHSQPSPQPSPLTRTEAYHSRKSSPGGTDPLNQVSLLSDISDQPKRRKPSLYAPHRATPTENSFPTRRSTPELLSHNDLSPHSSAVNVSRLHPSDSYCSPSNRRHPQLSYHHQHSPPDDRPYRTTYHPSTSLGAFTDSPSSVDRIPSRGDEGEKGQASVGTDDPGRSNQSPLTLPPLSQLTRHLKATKLQGGLRTAELGPPKSFEASAREARLHTPTSPQNNLLAIPTGRRSWSGRPLSVHSSSVSDSDSPTGLSSPVAYTSSSPDQRQLRQRQTESPITPPEGYSTPIDFHPRESAPTRQLALRPGDSLFPKCNTSTENGKQPPVEEVCQLKKRIAELELMVKRFGEVDGLPKTPLPIEHSNRRRHPLQFEDDGQLDQASDNQYEEDEVDMIDDSF
ncbi:hypothetical protein MJO28_015533 [Puccinia striiformis f. sp. tritici]|uniref:Uncharacterized protein n=1 Tax=Puccinia striiformis f. sp. tritici TaxID=168172 RepID=A0ACC0DRU1_9BASI|nr:hypothetical protein MJO28_015533 [Puccinia striiformis f. sp. tritici]